MPGSNTKRMLRLYEQIAGSPLMFLTGLFQSPASNFYTSAEVEVDIIRSDEDIAIAVQDLSAGYRSNAEDIYTSKKFTPPVFKEKAGLDSNDLLKRAPGDNPYQSPAFRENLIDRMFRIMGKIERKIRRAVEQQASQVLQTGKCTLVDADGNAIYEVDYKPKASHFPDAGVAWGNSGDDKIGDLRALIDVIRADSLADPDRAIFGEDAWEVFISDEAVQKRLDVRRIDLGTVSPFVIRGQGGQYRGTLDLGNYKIDLWTYNGRYKDPQTGASTPYIDPDNVVIQASSGRLDATFGAIPHIGRLLGGQQFVSIPELPGRMSSAGAGIDLHTNVWLSEDGEQLFGGVGSRPLMVPTAIDSYGCLNTQPS